MQMRSWPIDNMSYHLAKFWQRFQTMQTGQKGIFWVFDFLSGGMWSVMIPLAPWRRWRPAVRCYNQLFRSSSTAYLFLRALDQTHTKQFVSFCPRINVIVIHWCISPIVVLWKGIHKWQNSGTETISHVLHTCACHYVKLLKNDL